MDAGGDQVSSPVPALLLKHVAGECGPTLRARNMADSLEMKREMPRKWAAGAAFKNTISGRDNYSP
jgi:hypothetical protein